MCCITNYMYMYYFITGVSLFNCIVEYINGKCTYIHHFHGFLD